MLISQIFFKSQSENSKQSVYVHQIKSICVKTKCWRKKNL